jgi:hypothetical protein
MSANYWRRKSAPAPTVKQAIEYARRTGEIHELTRGMFGLTFHEWMETLTVSPERRRMIVEQLADELERENPDV